MYDRFLAPKTSPTVNMDNTEPEPTPEPTEAELEAEALANAREQVRQQRALDKAMTEEENSADKFLASQERTDVADLFAPTKESPEDEMERTDIEDMTDDAIPELSLTEQDNLDLFGVTDADIMGHSKKPRKKRLFRATGKRYTPAAGGLGGMNVG